MINQGKLVALGSPEQLIEEARKLKGDMFEVVSSDNYVLRELFRSRGITAYFRGKRLRVWGKLTESQLMQMLGKSGFEGKVYPAEVNMEDVFLYSFHQRVKLRLLWAVAEKEFKEIFRNPVMLLLAFGVPVVFFFVFGFGINLDVENLPLAIVDQDRSKPSQDFADEIYNNKYFTLVGYMDLNEAERLVRLNKLRAILVIPPGFSRRLHEGKASEVQVLIDGTYPYRADVIRGYITAVAQRFNEKLARKWLKQKGIDIELNLVELDVRSFYNQSIKSTYSLVPGVFVIVIMINIALLASISVVREKDYGTISNIYTSKISKSAFLLGKILLTG